MKAIINAKIIDGDQILKGHSLLFDKKILSITKEQPSKECEIIDAKGAYVSAGFVDIHIHGSGGADVMDATYEALETISKTLLQTGTTSFVATTMTMSQDDITKALDGIIKHKDEVSGAKIEGIHLEGPFISPLKCGAQDAKYIQQPSLGWIEPYLPHIKVITIAPELMGAREFIEYISQSYPDIVMSIGHSDASYEQSLESFEWGISHATHLFNAMSPWHHRKSGVVGAIFDSDITADLIADLIHIDPSALRSAQRLKEEKIILITDAMRAGCMKSGEYDLGGQRVNVKSSKATLDDGTIAGSTLRLNSAINNFITHTDATLIDAINAATSLPARLLELPVGELKEGYCADIVIFDEDIAIQKTYINGELKYKI